jgi:urocanate hydratase
VSIHNGGGVGWGEAINGGFGMVLDGSAQAERNLQNMLFFDVYNGIVRRAWAGNAPALFTAHYAVGQYPLLQVTLPYPVNENSVNQL